MATTKLYFCNQSSPYTPATIRGAWDQTSGSPITGLLSPGPSGSATTKGIAETNTNTAWDVLLARFISQPLEVGNAFLVTDTFRMIIGWLESNSAADMVPHIHCFVTQGDSDNVRGTLIADAVASPLATEELPTSATGQLFNNNSAIALSNNVTALAGDRIVIEIGYQAQNNSATSRTGTINYGNTGTTDLSDGSTNVATEPGFIEFTTTLALSFGSGEGEDSLGNLFNIALKPKIPILDTNNPITTGLVFDVSLFEKGGTVARDLALLRKGTLSNSPSWKTGQFGANLLFTDSTNKLGFTSTPKQDSLTDLSIETLVFVKGTNAASDARIIHKGNGDNKRWDLSIVASSKVEFVAVWNNGSDQEADWDTTSGLTTNRWYHIVVTYSFGSTANVPIIYVNAVPAAFSNIGASPAGSPVADGTDIIVGNRVTSLTKGFNGNISYVRYWNRILNKNEVKELYDNPWRIYKQLNFYSPLNALTGSNFSQTLTDVVTIVDTPSNTGGKVLSDVVTIVDTVLKFPSRTLSDVVTLVDTNLKTSGKVLTDIFTIVDPALFFTTGKVLTEVLTIVDSIVKSISRTFSDVFTVVDSALKTAGRNLAESFTVTDVIESLPGKIFLETVSVVDSIIRDMSRTLTDVLTVVDSAIKTPGRILSEILTIVSSVLNTGGKMLSETITVVDSFLRSIFKVFTEQISIVDVFSRILSRVFDEVISVADTFIKSTGRIILEALSVVDSNLKTVGRTLSESISLNDVLIAAIALGRTFQEALSVVDNFSHQIGKTFIETIGIDALFSVFGRWYRKAQTVFFTMLSTNWYEKVRTTFHNVVNSNWYTKNNTEWKD